MTRILHPFLLVICNSHETQWYRVESSNRMVELHKSVEEKARFSDNEGHSTSGGVSGGSLKTNEEWDEETRKHLNKTGEKTRELWGAEEYQGLIITAPENIKNQLMDAVDLESAGATYVPGNFTHPNLHHKLLEKIHEGSN